MDVRRVEDEYAGAVQARTHEGVEASGLAPPHHEYDAGPVDQVGAERLVRIEGHRLATPCSMSFLRPARADEAGLHGRPRPS